MNEQQKHRATTVLLIVLLMVVAVNQYMLMAVSSAQNRVTITGQAAAQQAFQPAALADDLMVGIPYNDQGYQRLMNYDKTIKLSGGEMQKYVGLDIELPCCGVKALQASGNCQCGHHVAMSGLAKYMAQKGYSEGDIQSELNKWKTVFYPDSTGSSAPGTC